MVNFDKSAYPTQQQQPAPFGGYGQEQPNPAPYGSAGMHGVQQPVHAMQSVGQQLPRPRFSDISPNWAWVVVAVIFFWPLGIAAASSAGRVVPAMLDGDYGRAYEQSRSARRLGIIALCLALGIAVLFFAVIVIAGANGAFDCAPDDPSC